MLARAGAGKGLPPVHHPDISCPGMTHLAIAMFLALFGFGDQLIGWSDQDGNVRLALFASFLFGVIAAYKINR